MEANKVEGGVERPQKRAKSMTSVKPQPLVEVEEDFIAEIEDNHSSSLSPFFQFFFLFVLKINFSFWFSFFPRFLFLLFFILILSSLANFKNLLSLVQSGNLASFKAAISTNPSILLTRDPKDQSSVIHHIVKSRPNAVAFVKVALQVAGRNKSTILLADNNGETPRVLAQRLGRDDVVSAIPRMFDYGDDYKFHAR